MLDLELFYNQVVCNISPNDRYFAILDIDDVLVVNFDCIFDRECNIRGTDQLIFLLHKLGHNKRFLFISEDGALIQASGALGIIENIIDCFELNNQTCAIACRENIDIENATVINSEAIPYWCRVIYPTIKHIPIPNGSFSKKFAVWFHRGAFYRLQITKHLTDNYKNDSYISYQEPGMIADRNLKKYFQDDIDWANINSPIIYDQLFVNRIYNFEQIVGSSRKPYNEYFLEIVAETDILSTNWITEKTIKNLYIGKPFILMCGVYSLKKIKSYGFKTFSPWIDESYDNIKNNHLRLTAIFNEIDRISKLSYSEITNINNKMQHIFEHNRNVYLTFINR